MQQAVEAGLISIDITVPFARSEDFYDELAFALAPWLSRREELLVSARIGLGTRPRPITGFSSRWQILAGLDALLHRTGLRYLDILYVHRLAPTTPVEETVDALADTVRQGKALYLGLSALPPSSVVQVNALLTEVGVPPVAYQASYSLMDRWLEQHALGVLNEQGLGATACAPLAHGLLKTREESHGRDPSGSRRAIVAALSIIARSRGQSVEQLAVSWALRDPRVTSALFTTTDPRHLTSLCEAATQTAFTPTELDALNACCPAPPQEQWTETTDSTSPGAAERRSQ
ncbi:aldo/keto reductase [Streptomyces vinaceus]|uniref:aldo/keto reductase n=1 Tax=Streptomyces vinaceus TaxID=1960 RepID=UPI0036B15EB7